jgi:peptidoglycan/LPS O-acetylase OafA/YrhL
VLIDVQTQYGIVLYYIIKSGHLGVQIFFVISGYGVANLIYRIQDQKPLNFLLNRLRRIYIPYFWSLVFASLIIPISISIVSMIKPHRFNHEFIKYSITEWLEFASLTKVFSSTSW